MASDPSEVSNNLTNNNSEQLIQQLKIAVEVLQENFKQKNTESGFDPEGELGSLKEFSLELLKITFQVFQSNIHASGDIYQLRETIEVLKVSTQLLRNTEIAKDQTSSIVATNEVQTWFEELLTILLFLKRSKQSTANHSTDLHLAADLSELDDQAALLDVSSLFELFFRLLAGCVPGLNCPTR